MCGPSPPKTPKITSAEDTIPPPSPPPEPTAQAPQDSPAVQKKRNASSKSRGTSALMVDLTIPRVPVNGVNIPR